MRKLFSIMLSIVLLSSFFGAAQAQDACPPSRLVPWQYARVAPGTSNRIREAASTASALVDSIPGNTVFFVYETGTCAEGYLWARVLYNNKIGWTPESKGSEYYVDPLPPPDGAIVIPADITDVAWSPDGKTIALATGNGVYLLDATDAKATPVQMTQDSTAEVEFSPTAPTMLATSAVYGMLRIWDISQKAVLHEEITGDPNALALDGNAVGSLQFSRDGKLLFAVGTNDLNAYDTTTWEIARSLKDYSVQRVGMSPDGEQLAVAAWYPDPPYLVDWSGKRTPLNVGGLSDAVYQVVYSPDGTMLAMNDNKGHVVRWMLATGSTYTYTAEYDTEYHLMTGLAFSPDSELLAMGDYTGDDPDQRGRLRLMDSSELDMDQIGVAMPYRTFNGKQSAFSPDGSKIAAVFDNVVLILNTADILK